MTGLDKIIHEITEEAKNAAAATIEEGREAARAIVEEAKRQAEDETSRREIQLKEEEEELLGRARSAAQLQKRKSILAAKQRMIAETIAQAKESLFALGDREYFGLLLKMVKKYSLGRQGDVCFSKKDLERLPEGFEKELAAAAGAPLRISGAPAEIGGGFILRYGGVEENCSFDAIFDARHDALQDTVGRVLFSES